MNKLVWVGTGGNNGKLGEQERIALEWGFRRQSRQKRSSEELVQQENLKCITFFDQPTTRLLSPWCLLPTRLNPLDNWYFPSQYGTIFDVKYPYYSPSALFPLYTVNIDHFSSVYLNIDLIELQTSLLTFLICWSSNNQETL